MIHEPYFRQGSGKNAVLLIHGIAGSPGHFRDLVPVIPEEFSVYNILLEGHNGTTRDFGHASMDNWKTQIKTVLEDLFARHEKVVITGHSMGTLFAIQAAIDHPDKIPALFLLNVPTRPRTTLQALAAMIQVAFGNPRSATARAMVADTGMDLSPRFWEYFGWTPRMLELLTECRRIRKQLPQLSTPTAVFQAQADELVSPQTCRELASYPCITLRVLGDSGHFHYGKDDTALLQKMLRQILSGDLTSPKLEL